MFSALPAAFAVGGIMLGWQRLEIAQSGSATTSASRSGSTEIAPLTADAISARSLPPGKTSSPARGGGGHGGGQPGTPGTPS